MTKMRGRLLGRLVEFEHKDLGMDANDCGGCRLYGGEVEGWEYWAPPSASGNRRIECEIGWLVSRGFDLWSLEIDFGGQWGAAVIAPHPTAESVLAGIRVFHVSGSFPGPTKTPEDVVRAIYTAMSEARGK